MPTPTVCPRYNLLLETSLLSPELSQEWSQNHALFLFSPYLLTAWCRVLLEKLTGLQLVKKFPAFHGTQRFITTLTSVCHLSLSWASPMKKSKHPACDCFLTQVFYREELLALRPTPKLEEHPPSAVRDCLFNLFAATLLIGGRSCIRNLRTRHAVVTGTHYMGRQSNTVRMFTN